MSDVLTPAQLDEIEARLDIEHNMSSTYTKARNFPSLFPIGREPRPCVYGKPHGECVAHNSWVEINGERRRQCNCTEDDELVLEYIVTNDVPALIAEVRELRAKVERVRAEVDAEVQRAQHRPGESKPDVIRRSMSRAITGRIIKALGEEA